MAAENRRKPTTTQMSLNDERVPPGVRRALVDAEWATSPDYRRMVFRHTLITGASVILLMGGITMFALTVFSREASYDPPLAVVVASVVLVTVGYLGVFYVISDRSRLRRVYRYKQALGLADELQERERSLADSGEPLSLPVLWSVTQERIEYYHQIVTTQSEVSFKNGAITSYFGLGLLLALAGIATFNTGDLATSITIGALGAVGAALSGYLGATFIRLQSEAAAQLREFFSQPVEFSRLLGAERLIESLPVDQRAQAVQLVIESMMRDRKAEK